MTWIDIDKELEWVIEWDEKDRYIGAISKHECVVDVWWVRELLLEAKRLHEALVKVMRYPESPHCDTSQRMRPIPDDCNCAYCKAREVLGWEVCPVCEYVSDIGSDDKHYEDSECLNAEGEEE